MKKRALAMFLTTAIAVSVFSCGNETTPTVTDTSASDTTAEAVTTENPLADKLPEKDYKGQQFNITVNTYCESGYFSEAETGDVLSDAIYARNQAIEERFNVKLNYISGVYKDTTGQIQNTVLAGDDEYQLLAHHALNANSWVLSGILLDWNSIPYVDFSRPWWSTSNSKELKYNNVTLLAAGDFALSTIGRTYAIYYDKVIAEDYKLPDMYKLVNDGKWTIDKLSELSRDVYTDLNKNGQRDFDDLYGFTTSTGTDVTTFMYSSGIRVIDDGEIVMNIEKMHDILEKVSQLVRGNTGTFYDTNYKNSAGNGNYVGAEKMAVSTTLFASAMIETGMQYLRNTGNDYGILPYPKWDENQADYVSMVDGGLAMLAVPKTVSDVEMVGIIAEALCAETYREVVPVYTEVALKEKGVRDEESIAMIEYLLARREYDFGYIYDNFKGYGFCLYSLVKNKTENFMSWYEANRNSKEAYYQSIFEAFENYGA